MKIAIYHNLPPGGAKRVLCEEVKYLSLRNELFLYELSSTDEVHFSLKDYVKKIFRYQYDSQTIVHGFWPRLKKDFGDFFLLPKIHQQIGREIDKENFDVVLVHPDQLTQAPFLLRFLRTPRVYFAEEVLRFVDEYQFRLPSFVKGPKRWYEGIVRYQRRNIDQENAEKASMILTNSHFIAEAIFRRYGITAKVCYPGVDSTVFKPLSSKILNKLFFVAPKIESSGYDLLNQALEIIPSGIKPKVSFVSPEKGKMRLTDEEMAREYSSSLATLALSRLETFGLAPIESMACKTPVIAVNEGGHRETIINDVTGFLVDPEPKSIAAKIIKLANDHGLRKKMGEEGREYVLKNFSWKRHNEILETALKEVSLKK